MFSYSLSLLASLPRFFYMGGAGKLASSEPGVLLELYEFEGCPHCRLAREALSELGFAFRVLPCPKGGDTYRQEVIERGGKAQFPWLRDPAAGVEMYESGDIIHYLHKTYGSGRVPWYWLLLPLQRMLSVLAILPRAGQGVVCRGNASSLGEVCLEGSEVSPKTRLFREELAEYQVPYVCQPSTGEVRLTVDGETISLDELKVRLRAIS